MGKYSEDDSTNLQIIRKCYEQCQGKKKKKNHTSENRTMLNERGEFILTDQRKTC